MHPYATLQTPDGHTHALGHGDMIGRIWSAALQLNDGRISEAHAMVSLREGQLQLVALRGSFAVHGEPMGQVVLTPGLKLELARGLELLVMEVWLPEEVLGLEGPGFLRQMLPGVCSLVLDPHPRLCSGYREGAALHLWDTGDGWMQQVPQQSPQPLQPGQFLKLGNHVLQALAIPLRASGPPTQRQGEVDRPLHIQANYDTVHIQRQGEIPVVFSGKQARLISELVSLGCPSSWQSLSEELWPEEDEPLIRRSRLDVVLSRIRRSLRARGVRSDLVRTDGAGMVELLLYPHDTVEDRS